MKKEQTMRVLLIRPHAYFESLVFPDGPWVGIPLGLLAVQAGLTNLQNVEVKIIDAFAEADLNDLRNRQAPIRFGMSEEALARATSEFRPDVIGISSNAQTFFEGTIETAELLRASAPHALIVAGGTDPTAQPTAYLDRCPSIDLVVQGEGEQTFAAVIEATRKGETLDSIQGLRLREKAGTTQGTGRAAYVEELDNYPIDYSSIDLERYFMLNRAGFAARRNIRYPNSDRAVLLVTSRGCPHVCSFCSIHLTMGRQYRCHSESFVMSQLRELVEKYGVRHIHFEDDHLTLNRTRFKNLLRAIIESDLNITWDTPNGTRIDTFDREMLELCKQSGCVYLMFGIESGRQKVLDEIIDKNLDLAEVDKTLTLCKEIGLDTMALFIFGVPGETKSDVQATYDYAFELFRKYQTIPFVSLFKPMPGTDLHQLAVKKDLIVSAREKRQADNIPHMLFQSLMTESAGLELAFLEKLYRRYMVRFAFRSLWGFVNVVGRRPVIFSRILATLFVEVLKRPMHAPRTMREFAWRQLIFPRAVVRHALEGKRSE